MKTILKQKTTWDGFKIMIGVLAASAFLVLGLGIYFLVANF